MTRVCRCIGKVGDADGVDFRLRWGLCGLWVKGGVGVDCRVLDFRRETRLLDVVDAVLARFELEFEVEEWESCECRRDKEDAADLALRD